MKALAVNPVLRRELLERWRGRRTFVVLTAYVTTLALLMQLLWWWANHDIEQHARFAGFEDFALSPSLGRFLFDNLLGFVLLLVLFIAPGYAAAQIAGERERRTLSLLQVTLVRPWSIALGKLGASVAWLLLLVVAALPFGAATFFLGGVSAGDLAKGALALIVIAISLAAISLGISSFARRTSAAVVTTYGLVLFLTIGTGFGHLIETSVRELNFTGSTSMSLHLNPFYGVADAAGAARQLYVGRELPTLLSPFASQLPFGDGGMEHVMLEGGFVEGEFLDAPAFFEERIFEEQGFVGPDFVGFDEEPEDVWWRVLAIYAGLGLVGFVVAARRLRPDRVPPRYRRRVKGANGTLIEPLPDLTVDPPPATAAGDDEEVVR
ncbi:MAG: ABC transporter permease [Actinobacteria bacterium]|nr:ABC transporter permease [Actinomycetota bacterium]